MGAMDTAHCQGCLSANYLIFKGAAQKYVIFIEIRLEAT